MKELLRRITNIEPVDDDAMSRAKAREDSLAKPPESLGKLEDMAVKLAGIRGISGEEDKDPLGPGCIIVFCADNGVTLQGVSSAPQTVTRAQTVNFTRRLTGVGALADSFGSELLIVDVGVKDPIPADLYDQVPFRDTRKIVDRKIGPGTRDISQGPAMTREEAIRAMLAGMEMAEASADAGYGMIGIGEMGIGNTTTSAAVLSALTGEGSELTCGRGGGINDDSFMTKKKVVENCFRRYLGSRTKPLLREFPIFAREGRMIGAGDDSEARLVAVTELLADLGGFDICAMTGAYLGAAARRIPVVIDGYISVVAALAAAVIAPEARGYMFASHKSVEPGYGLAIEELGLKPFLDLDMRLGEGSGCAVAFAVIRGAWDVFMNMGTFEEARIDDSYLEKIRGGGCF